MFGSAILETFIGTVLLYILCSLVCSAASEWYSQFRKLRPVVLREELGRLLGADLAGRIEVHPLIEGLSEGATTPAEERYPDYIPPATFAMALIDIGYSYTPGAGGNPGTIQVKSDAPNQTLLNSLKLESRNLGALQTRIEQWFSLSTEQVTGRYKKRVQKFILLFAFALAVAANIDTVALTQFLYDGALTNQPLKFPLGWPLTGFDPARIPSKFFGLFISGAAISLGAPFWFDVLNKLVNLRQAGIRPAAGGRTGSGLVAQ